MAANLRSRGLATVGKQLVRRQISYHANFSRASLLSRRAVHDSVYDKNLEENVRPAVVPDNVIQLEYSDKYWAPHPQTGVFGPAIDSTPAVDNKRSFHSSPVSENSVLEQKAFFRSLEDLEKPLHHP